MPHQLPIEGGARPQGNGRPRDHQPQALAGDGRRKPGRGGLGRASPALQAAFGFGGSDHRAVYREIRNFLAGQALGATRDRALLDELLKLLFSKHYLDRAQRTPGVQESGIAISQAYESALQAISARLPRLFPSDAAFALNYEALAFLHGSLVAFDLDDPRVDMVGDAFELFTGSEARGQEGQFFTPQNAIALLVELVDPRPGERIIDPACGAGGFLSATVRHLIAGGATTEDAVSSVFGIDKDRYLAQLAATRLAFFGFTEAQVTCADSLGWRTDDGSAIAAETQLGTFDAVLTNPPFGSRIIAATPAIQRSFELGHKWRIDPTTGHHVKLTSLTTAVPPQVLFVERSLSLVRPGGRVGIVVPESLISGRNYRHVIAWIRERAHIRAVVGMPEALFKTSGKGGTHTKTCLVLLERLSEHSATSRRYVFMAETRWCGNDSRGRRNGRDELPAVAQRWRLFLRDAKPHNDHLGYAVSEAQLVDDILAPRYYNPEVAAELATLAPTHELVPLGDLVSSGILEIRNGNEVGAEEYGTGSIPFVRTSDLSNWEIKIAPKHGVSEDTYERFRASQDIREGDILMVRDGTYLVGTCAFVTKYDTRIVLQSHILKLRVRDTAKLSPYLLLAALSSQPVRKQVVAKRFTQDIIDSLGNRVLELVLPLPRDLPTRQRIADMVRRAIDDRVEAREIARQACIEVAGGLIVADDDDTVDVDVLGSSTDSAKEALPSSRPSRSAEASTVSH